MGYKAQEVAATTPFTGSISKIYCPTATNITSWAFGNNTDPHTAVASTTSTIVVPAGSYFEGPLIQYIANAKTIAYTT